MMFRMMAESFDRRTADKFQELLLDRSHTTTPEEMEELKRLLGSGPAELFLLNKPLALEEVRTHLKLQADLLDHTVHMINFPTPHPLKEEANNRVYAKFYRSKVNPGGPVVMMFPGWMTRREDGYYREPLGNMLLEAGINYIFYTMPYHIERTPEGYLSGELAVSGNLLRTVQAFRQALTECRTILHWVREDIAPTKIGLLGISLGGWLAAHLMHVVSDLDFAILMIPGVDQTAILWQTEIARSIRADVEKLGLNPKSYGELFTPLQPTQYEPLLNPEKVLIIRAQYDQCVPEESVEAYSSFLKKAQVQVYPHGHFSILYTRKPIRGITQFIRNQT